MGGVLRGDLTNGLPASERTTVRRLSDRGKYDRETIHAILDEALICHVGFVEEGQPLVIPTIHVRIGDELFFHGSNASRLLAVIGSGAPVCVTVTLLDALVLARSAFDHSMNYRSVVVLGAGRLVKEREPKLAALVALSEHVIPGRWDEVRSPSEQELNATTVACIPITEASAKIRSGPPKDRAEDYDLAVWAGLLPLSITAGLAIPDPRMKHDLLVPEYVRDYCRCES